VKPGTPDKTRVTTSIRRLQLKRTAGEHGLFPVDPGVDATLGGMAGARASPYQGSAGSPAVQPPSTGSTTPVIALASGLARKTIAPAISSA
jgi:hypothetical protein